MRERERFLSPPFAISRFTVFTIRRLHPHHALTSPHHHRSSSNKKIRNFRNRSKFYSSPPPSFSRLLLSVSDLVNATNLCAGSSREIESLSLSLSPRARARQTDRSEYVRRRKRLNTEPVSIRGISSVYFGIYIRVRRGSLPKPCRTASTRIYTGPVSSLAMPYRFEEA